MSLSIGKWRRVCTGARVLASQGKSDRGGGSDPRNRSGHRAARERYLEALCERLRLHHDDGGHRTSVADESALPAMTRIARRVAATLLVAVLTTFYYAAASQHARVVNTSKARGDQSGYLWDAQQVYRNWHGRNPPMLIGQRMRM